MGALARFIPERITMKLHLCEDDGILLDVFTVDEDPEIFRAILQELPATHPMHEHIRVALEERYEDER